MLIKQRPLLGDINHSDPVLKEIFDRRSAGESTDLDIKNLLHYSSLSDIEEATDVVIDAIKSQKKILILGDYDADGATSTAILTDFLIKVGANVSFTVPDRINEGYGMTPALIDRVKVEFNPALIITVDNGISAISEVEMCRKLNIDVLITDHHISPRERPKALAILNPNQQDCQFPSKSIAGVGVVFYLLVALRKKMNLDINITSYLDLVAIGTIADTVVLDYNNRLLVQRGLKIIRDGASRAGVRALLQICKKKFDHKVATYQDIGFFLAPKINAAGRLSDMTIGIRCLLEENYDKALVLASELDNLNENRKKIEKTMSEQARIQLDTLSLEPTQRKFVSLFNEDWHQGIIGILASRIKDRYWQPTFIFTAEQDNRFIKGSGRSVDGVHLRDVIALVDTMEAGLISRFGGHAMAAGLSLPRDNLPRFEELFGTAIDVLYPNIEYQNVLYYDTDLPSSYLNIEFAKTLLLDNCFGHGYHTPVFVNKFYVINSSYRDDYHLQKFSLRPLDASNVLEAFVFEESSKIPKAGDEIKIAYQLGLKRFNNQESLSIKILKFL